MAKFARLIEVLIEDGLTSCERLIEPQPAPRAWLERVHDRGYVEGVLAQTLAPAASRRIGFPLSSAMALRAQTSVGGTVLTARLALDHGMACSTAGGGHHAFSDHGAGFCVFNDVAVAVRVLQAEGRIRRALIIDLDVHQGDGTAEIFAGDHTVFTFSMHCAANYPPHKQRSDLDIALPPGTGDSAYLEALSRGLDGLIAAARPDIAFFNAGVDPHAEDGLGLFGLSDAGLEERERRVLQMCHSAGIPVAGITGGGYGRDVDRLARRHAILHRTAARLTAV
jgi:acetoin utilization deacetylase AcuC-like enzyme